MAFLEPAKTRQWEAGVKIGLFEDAIFTAAYFDISQPLAELDNADFFRYNGSQDHRGVELTLTGDVTENLRLVAGGLWLNAEIGNPKRPDLAGKRPGGVPEFQFNLFADYEPPFIEGLALNGGLFPARPQQNPRHPRIPG